MGYLRNGSFWGSYLEALRGGSGYLPGHLDVRSHAYGIQGCSMGTSGGVRMGSKMGYFGVFPGGVIQRSFNDLGYVRFWGYPGN